MATLELWGHFTEDGKKIEFDVPEGVLPEQVPEGAIKAVIEMPVQEQKAPKQSLYGLWADQGVDLSIARALARIDVSKVPDMPDRIITATALARNILLISRDAKIQVSGITTIW